MSPVGFHITCSLTFWENFPPSGFHKCKRGTNVVLANLSIVTTIAYCRFCCARTTFTTADGKVAKSARCCALVPSRCFATCLWYQGRFSLSLCYFCAIVLPTRLSACRLLDLANCAGSRACFLLHSLLHWFCT